MACPHCRSTATTTCKPRTTLGYPRFTCQACGRRCNERTGTPFNDLHHPTDIVLLAVLWRLRYTRSFRDVAELLLERGYAVTHETIRDWEFRFAPLLAERLRTKRRGRAGRFLVPRRNRCEGRRTLVLPVSRHRSGGDADRFDVERAPRQTRRAPLPRGLLQVAERKPLRITTNGHPAYRKAIRWIIGRTVRHRCNQSLNNAIEQDHRAIKQRYYPMRGSEASSPRPSSAQPSMRCASTFAFANEAPNGCRSRSSAGSSSGAGGS